MAIQSCILTWKIPWTEGPGGLQSTGSQRVAHNWVTNIFTKFNHLNSLESSGDSGTNMWNDYNDLIWTSIRKKYNPSLEWNYWHCKFWKLYKQYIKSLQNKIHTMQMSTEWKMEILLEVSLSAHPLLYVLAYAFLPSRFLNFAPCNWGFPGGSAVKNPLANAEDARDSGSICGSRRSPGGGDGNRLQYSCLRNFMDRGSWWATVHRVTKSWTQLSNWIGMHSYRLRYHL